MNLVHIKNRRSFDSGLSFADATKAEMERWWGEDGYAYHEQNGLLYVEVSNANNARMSVQRLLSFNVKAGIAKSVSIEPKLKEAA